jgi:secreted trypsin-like serine protease
LIKNRELKNLIASRINQLRGKHGYKDIDFSNKNRTMNHKVINGKLATLGQFPFQARLIVTKCKGEFICGGVLVSPCHILTAKEGVQN